MSIINYSLHGKTMKNFTKNAVLASALLLGVNFMGCAEWRAQKTIGENIDDTNIVTKIKAQLVAEHHIAARNISVNSQKGVVQLSGFVNKHDDIDKAITIAKNVKGVHRVINHIVVQN